jgi:hypothetical protein
LRYFLLEYLILRVDRPVGENLRAGRASTVARSLVTFSFGTPNTLGSPQPNASIAIYTTAIHQNMSEIQMPKTRGVRKKTIGFLLNMFSPMCIQCALYYYWTCQTWFVNLICEHYFSHHQTKFNLIQFKFFYEKNP